MGRFIGKLIAFWAFASMIYVALVILWGELVPSYASKNLNHPQGGYGHMFTRMKEVKTMEKVDVLFLGSSHAYRGFDTRSYEAQGYRVFNLGSSSQTPIQTKVLLERYLDRLDPQMVVYEVCPSTLSVDGVESALDLLANDCIDAHVVDMAIELNHIKVYNSLIYGAYHNLTGGLDHFTEPARKGADTYITGGFVEKELSYYEAEAHPAWEWAMTGEQKEAFDEVITLLKERGVQVVLVQTPVTSKRYKSCKNRENFEAFISNYGKLYDFNKSLDLNDQTDFYDADHLNRIGVQKLNGELQYLLTSLRDQ